MSVIGTRMRLSRYLQQRLDNRLCRRVCSETRSLPAKISEILVLEKNWLKTTRWIQLALQIYDFYSGEYFEQILRDQSIIQIRK